MQLNHKEIHINLGMYLISLPLGDNSWSQLNSQANILYLSKLKFWVVENAKMLRRYISSCNLGVDISQLQLVEWNKHGNQNEVYNFLETYAKNNPVGLVSDAGMPAVADPGALAVAWAHKNKVSVYPVVGASSLYLALAASGFNGQNFAFNGYLPIDKKQLVSTLQLMNGLVQRHQSAQIFIETPYRNDVMLQTIIATLPPQTLLCIACNLHNTNEFVCTQTLADWKNNLPKLHKLPTVFILGSF